MERKIVENANVDELIPEQIEQCVTSNWIDIKEKAVVATAVLHADPIRSMHDFHNAALGNHNIPKERIDAIQMEKYAEMQFIESRKGYEILNPPFGSNCHVEVLLERPVAKHFPELQSAIQQHNKDQLNSWVKNEDDRTIQLASSSDLIGTRMAALKQDMLNHCRPSFWQRLFKTQEYRQKMEAASIIERSFSLIMSDFQDQKAENLFLLVLKVLIAILLKL